MLLIILFIDIYFYLDPNDDLSKSKKSEEKWRSPKLSLTVSRSNILRLSILSSTLSMKGFPEIPKRESPNRPIKIRMFLFKGYSELRGVQPMLYGSIGAF